MTKLQRGRRRYDQECGLAYGLDQVGERWTLLIIRELLVRPRRYHELLNSLPGIGTNLLSERLSFLTAVGLVAPVDPTRRTAGYTVTELGRTLREPILGLAQFGLLAGAGHPRPDNATIRPAWAALAIEAMSATGEVPEVDETYQFDVDGEIFQLVIADGRPAVRDGPADAPDMVVSTDAQTFFDMGRRRLDPVEALVSGAVRVAGSSAAVPRCLRLIGLVGAEARLAASPAAASR